MRTKTFYYPAKVQSQKHVTPAEILRGSPGHRPLRGRPPALQIGFVLFPELVQEVVLLQRKRARYL